MNITYSTHNIHYQLFPWINKDEIFNTKKNTKKKKKLKIK